MSASGQSVAYPLRGDYVDALQNPRLAFADVALKTGTAHLDKLGMPRAISGNFASIFQMEVPDGSRWAVKCFCQYVPDQEKRYGAISTALRSLHHSSLVEFEYQKQGVLVVGVWYPILKMEWVEAQGLLSWLDDNRLDSRRVATLADQFAEMVAALEAVNIAHGDLQHGNLLVGRGDQLRLIDYDGMYVPALAGLRANEKGLANYQAPTRTDLHFGPGLDRFSAWVIYTSLVAVAQAPELWRHLRSNGDEKLLFDKQDYARPTTSEALKALRDTRAPQLTALADMVIMLTSSELDAMPPLDPTMIPASSTTSTPAAANQPRTTGGLPEWIPSQGGYFTTPETPQPMAESPGVSWVAGHLPALQAKTFTSSKGSVKGVRARVIVAAVVGLGATGVSTAAGLGVQAIAVTLLASFLLICAALVRGFLRHPDRAGRRSARKSFAEARSSLSDSKRLITKLQGARLDVDNEEKESQDRLDRQRDTITRALKRREDTADANLRKTLGRLASERKKAGTSIATEREKALKRLRDAHISHRLNQLTIRKNPPHGIGNTLVSRLEAAGIRTAADFTKYRVTSHTSGRRVQASATLVRSNGTAVHIEGIGPAKAAALVAWRDSVINNAARSTPAALPPADEKALRDRLMVLEARITADEEAARRQAITDREAAINEFRKELDRLSQEAQQAAVNAASRRLAIATDIDAAAKDQARAEYAVAMARRQADAYSAITFAKYATFVATGRA